MALFTRLADVADQLEEIGVRSDLYLARLRARKQAFVDMHNADQDPPVDIDGMDEDDDADVQLDTLDFMQQMQERLDA